MDFPHSEAVLAIGRLQHAVWHGDWDDAAHIAAALGKEATAVKPEALKSRLAALNQILDAARTRRSEMQTALARLRAVSGFNA